MPSFSITAARLAAENGQFSLSLQHYFAVLKLKPSSRRKCEAEFLVVLKRHSDGFTERAKIDECFDLAAQVYPESTSVLNLWASALFRAGCWNEAALCYLRVLDLDSENGEARANVANLRTHLLDQWHFRMVNDLTRNRAYNTAMQKLINRIRQQGRGACVLDVGSGAGLLGALATAAGAPWVTCVEQSAVLCHVARRVFRQLQRSPSLNQMHSRELLVPDHLPRKADILVTELMDAGFFGEDIVGTLVDAKERLLAPDGVVIPCRGRLFGALLECDALRRQFVALPNKAVVGSDMRLRRRVYYSPLAADEPYTSERLDRLPGGYRLLSESVLLTEIELNSSADLSRHLIGYSHHVTAISSLIGRADAIACWWQADLLDDASVQLCSHPDGNTCWEQALFPLCPPLEIHSAGQRLDLQVAVKRDWFDVKLLRVEEISPSTVFMPSTDEVSLLNDSSFLSSVKGWCLSSSEPFQVVVDLSSLPPLTFLAAAVLKDATIVHKAEAKKHQPLLKAFAEDNPAVAERVVQFSGDEQMSDLVKEKVSPALLCCPVTASGILRQNCLEDIAFYRLRHSISRVLPSTLRLIGQLVSSQSLLADTRVLTNQKTLGIPIGQSLNVFATTTQLDVEPSTLPDLVHLSDPFELLCLDLEERLEPNSDRLPEFLKCEKRSQVALTDQAQLCAVLAWFEFSARDPKEKFETRNGTGGYFKCAAFMLEDVMCVKKDDFVTVECRLDRSTLFVNVK